MYTLIAILPAILHPSGCSRGEGTFRPLLLSRDEGVSPHMLGSGRFMLQALFGGAWHILETPPMRLLANNMLAALWNLDGESPECPAQRTKFFWIIGMQTRGYGAPPYTSLGVYGR